MARISSPKSSLASTQASSLIRRRGLAGGSDFHGPPKVNFWEDPMSPSKWKEEHFVIVSLTGWGLLFYGGYNFVTKGNDKKEEEDDESKNLKSLRVSLLKEEEEEGERSIVVLPNNFKEVEIDDPSNVGEESSRLPLVEGELWFNVEVLRFEGLSKQGVLVDRSQLQLMPHGSNGTTFSCLRQLHVRYCRKLKHLFKLELVPYFPNLESIYVVGCDEMEELVGVEESDELCIVNDALTITFPNHVESDECYVSRK